MSNKNSNKDSNKDSVKDPKDGFDLIEYPCEYAFKAMCRAQSDSDGRNSNQHIQSLILQHVNKSAIGESHTNKSRTGKFESVTVTVLIDSRDELETIYRSIAASPRVVMTL